MTSSARWVIGAVVIATAPAWARKPELPQAEVAVSAADIPPLAGLLDRAGWPTPELSGVFLAGNVFEVTDHGHRLLSATCIAEPPVESSYTSAELVVSMQAGVTVGNPIAAIGASAGLVKKMKFGAPLQRSIPGLGLELTAPCREKLARLDPAVLASAYVVQEVLLAEIVEQTCGYVDVKGRIVNVGPETELGRACMQEALEPVAVGYRRVPLAALLVPEEPPPPPPPAPTVPTVASIVADHLPAMRSCFAAATARTTDGVGVLDVRYAIRADGRVRSAYVSTQQRWLDDRAAQQCVVGLVLGLAFPPPGRPMDEQFTIPFGPAPDAAAR
jgi:hypothetical protein